MSERRCGYGRVFARDSAEIQGVSAMIEITWRYDPASDHTENEPATPADALALLDAGNREFANLDSASGIDRRLVIPVTAADLGIGGIEGEAPSQEPFVALLGCADARVPPELLFMQSANDAFVVRVAGNVLGAECVGSLEYAITHLQSLRLLTVMGHTGCGAVAAAVDSYLRPIFYLGLSSELPLRAVVDAIMAAVRGADVALRRGHGDEVVARPGYRLALIDTAVVLNAAVAADAIRTMFAARLGADLDVVFGVYDLVSRRVGLPLDSDTRWTPGLTHAPHGDEFLEFVRAVVTSAHVTRLLDLEPSGAH